MKLKEKALKVIESLVSDGFCEDMAMDRVNERYISQEDARLMARKIGMIYRFSHSANAHSCYDVHGNWREEMVDLYDKSEEEKGQLTGIIGDIKIYPSKVKNTVEYVEEASK